MANSYTFEQPGICYVLDGVWYEVLYKLDDGQVAVRNLMTLEKSGVSVKLLRQRLFGGHVHFAHNGDQNLRKEVGHPLKTSYIFTDLSFLPKDLQYETWLRYTIIKPLTDLKPRERTKRVVLHRVAVTIEAYLQWVIPHDKEAVLARLGGPAWWSKYQLKTPPVPAQDILELLEEARQKGASILLFHGRRIGISERSINRWIFAFQASHQEIQSLVPARSERGPNEPTRMAPLVQEKLSEAVAEVFNTEERPTVQKTLDILNGKLTELNSQQPEDQQLDLVKKDTVYRALARLDPIEVDSARFGQEYAEREHHQSQQGPRPNRPNKRWEIDHGQLDLLVIDEVDMLPIGRPTYTLINDAYSFYPPGFSISFEPASYLTVMEAYFYAAIEKDFVKPVLGLQHDYLPYGISEQLACDNAPEFRQKGRDLKSAGAQLGFEIDWMPRRTPWFKPKVERFYGTTNTEVIHSIPGTTFSNFLQRGDYDPSRFACITLNGLWYLLHHWLVDIYAQDWRRGGRGSLRHNGQGVPAKLWEEALEHNFVPRLPPSRETLLVLLGRMDMRSVHAYGIEFECLYYNSHKLDALRTRLHGEEVLFKYNPADLSRIWVLDPFSKTYLEVLAVDQEYTKGLSLWKHEVIKRFVREEMKQKVDQASLATAKYRLHQLVREEFRLMQQMRTRKRMARFLNIQVARFLRGMPDSQSSTDIEELQLEKELAARPISTRTTQLIAAPSGGTSEITAKTSVSMVSADLEAVLPPTIEGVSLVEPEKSSPTSTSMFDSSVAAPTILPKSTTKRSRGRPSKTPTPSEQPAESRPTIAPQELTAEQRARFGITVSFTKVTPD